MFIRKIIFRTFYICAASLVLTIFVAEFSQKIEVSTLEELGLSIMVIALLIAAGMLRNACIESPKQKYKIAYNTLLMIYLFYLFYLIWILFFDSFYDRVSLKIDFHTYFLMKTNFVPFVTIHRYLINISGGVQTNSAILNLVGNLAAFMPMGFFCPMIFKPMRKPLIFIPSLLLFLIGVEGMQLLMRVGSCDVDDVILNLLGAMIIYVLVKPLMIQKWLKRPN